MGIEGKCEIVSPTPIYIQALGVGASLGASEAVAGSDAAEERWRINPGAGRNAAEAISRAPALDDARAIWDAYCSAPHRTDMAWAFWAFPDRLDDAGHGEEVAALSFNLTGSGEDMDPDDEIMATVR